MKQLIILLVLSLGIACQSKQLTQDTVNITPRYDEGLIDITYIQDGDTLEYVDMDKDELKEFMHYANRITIIKTKTQ